MPALMLSNYLFYTSFLSLCVLTTCIKRYNDLEMISQIMNSEQENPRAKIIVNSKNQKKYAEKNMKLISYKLQPIMAG